MGAGTVTAGVAAGVVVYGGGLNGMLVATGGGE